EVHAGQLAWRHLAGADQHGEMRDGPERYLLEVRGAAHWAWIRRTEHALARRHRHPRQQRIELYGGHDRIRERHLPQRLPRAHVRVEATHHLLALLGGELEPRDAFRLRD